MNICLISFTNDIASQNIYNNLLDSNNEFIETSLKFDSFSVFNWEHFVFNKNLYLLKTNRESVYYDNLDEVIFNQINIEPDILIFLTKHESASKINSLSCHAPGNWSVATMGGINNNLSIALPILHNLFYNSMVALNNSSGLNFDVILECTHHGPSIKTPSIFIEIGSCEESWSNNVAGKIISDTLISNLSKDFLNIGDSKKLVGLGIGGLHHCPSFTKLMDEDLAFISHVCPKYKLDSISFDILESAVLNSIPAINCIIIDWKGLGKFKEKIKPIIKVLALKYKLKVYKTKNLFELDVSSW